MVLGLGLENNFVTQITNSVLGLENIFVSMITNSVLGLENNSETQKLFLNPRLQTQIWITVIVYLC